MTNDNNRAVIWGSIAACIALASCAPLPTANAPVRKANINDAKLIEGPVGFGQTAYVNGPTVTPMELLEDSRCPTEVNCVWAGQVRVKVRVAGGSWSKEMELVNAKPVHVADGALTLMGITPEKSQNTEIALSDYRFHFQFQGGF